MNTKVLGVIETIVSTIATLINPTSASQDSEPLAWWNTLSTADALTIIISLIAVVFSIVSFVFTFLQTKRAQKTTLEAEYFTYIFKDYLSDKIPEARNKIHFVKEEIEQIDDLVDNLNALRKNARYFRYSDKKFYDKLKSKQQKLEDMLIEALNKTYDYDDQVSFLKKVDTSLRSIYVLINKRYYSGH